MHGRKLLKMNVLAFETCWAVNSEIIKQVTSVGLSLFNYQDDARSQAPEDESPNIRNMLSSEQWNN